MTALAVALVLCCAMVCGTRIAVVRLSLLREEAQRARYEAGGAMHKTEGLEAQVKSLSSEVESLRAQVALRSM
jgi:hypothetical protein